jgi:regulatory protein
VTDDGPTTDARREVFRDAEAFLAELGVERRPIVVRAEADARGPGAAGPVPDQRSLAEAAAPLAPGAREVSDDGSDRPASRGSSEDGREVDGPPAAGDGSGPPVSVAEATRIATESPLPDDVATAVSYVRRSTAAQPAAEGRLRARLADRGHAPDVVDAAMGRARAERLVDDDALSAALVAEWRAKGHAPRRIRVDLRRRGFDEDVVERAVGQVEVEDQTVMAFDLARRRAETLAHLPPETAFRRVVGYVARRGYGEGLARKVARDAVYDQRNDDRVAGH